MGFLIETDGVTSDGAPYRFRYSFYGSYFEVGTGKGAFRARRRFDLLKFLPSHPLELKRYLALYETEFK